MRHSLIEAFYSKGLIRIPLSQPRLTRFPAPRCSALWRRARLRRRGPLCSSRARLRRAWRLWRRARLRCVLACCCRPRLSSTAPAHPRQLSWREPLLLVTPSALTPASTARPTTFRRAGCGAAVAVAGAARRPGAPLLLQPRHGSHPGGWGGWWVGVGWPDPEQTTETCPGPAAGRLTERMGVGRWPRAPAAGPHLGTAAGGGSTKVGRGCCLVACVSICPEHGSCRCAPMQWEKPPGM